MKNINKAITFAKKETVLIVAMLLAVISAFSSHLTKHMQVISTSEHLDFCSLL